MADQPEIVFTTLGHALEPTAAVLVGAGLAWGGVATSLNGRSGGALARAAEAAQFKAKAKSSIELLGLADLVSPRLVLVGAGDAATATDSDWIALGGYIYAQLAGRKTSKASLVIDLADSSGGDAAAIAADVALGALLRSYKFDKYMTKKPAAATEGEGEPAGNVSGDDKADATDGLKTIVVHTADPAGARAAFERREAIGQGVWMARDLVNEPANVLDPVEFANRCLELEKLGVQVEILDLAALQELKMGALLGVAQGSIKEPRVVVMQWHGAKSKRAKPLAFLGKGVTFDSGGLSMKPAAGMEDMKGDMAGAACVVGLMRALAGRKAAVNVVGLIGLVENMNSHIAQRPGDIVTSMSGQTVEVLNTDAEGRLVLCDVVHYTQERFKPKFMVDLATLTGAIMVALGKEYAGLFANDDKLAAELFSAGEATGEKVWRMPLAPAYDKLIDSKNADMKNIGGRYGGAITAAHFIGRFVKNTPWAHLDIAGTAMDSTRNDINQSWGSGWGVRLLDRMVADHHEKGEK